MPGTPTGCACRPPRSPAWMAEWDAVPVDLERVRAKSRRSHQNKAARARSETCGPAQLDKMLTEARAAQRRGCARAPRFRSSSSSATSASPAPRR